LRHCHDQLSVDEVGVSPSDRAGSFSALIAINTARKASDYVLRVNEALVIETLTLISAQAVRRARACARAACAATDSRAT
jgi:hypothetical protein